MAKSTPGSSTAASRCSREPLEGSLITSSASVVAGFVWSHFVDIPLAAYLVGALVAAVTEMLPWEVNDKLRSPDRLGSGDDWRVRVLG